MQWLAVTVSAVSEGGVAGFLPASQDGAADSTPFAVLRKHPQSPDLSRRAHRHSISRLVLRGCCVFIDSGTSLQQDMLYPQSGSVQMPELLVVS